MRHIGVKLLFLYLLGSPVVPWDYDDQDDWNDEYPYCGMEQQSPINIVSNQAKLKSGLWPINITEHKGRYAIQNNGDTVKILPVNSRSAPFMPMFENGANERFQIAEIHFHWGLDDSAGSEHAIDGKRFQMEMHVVGFRAEYGDFDIAKHNRNGLVVIAFLLNRSNQVNDGIRQIVLTLPSIKTLNALYAMPPMFSISSLIPSTIPSYYEYYGSLTTPPCYEVVKFVVAKNMISVTKEQLEQFRKVTNLEQTDDRKQPEMNRDDDDDDDDDDNEEKIAPNYRQLQQLNKRLVFSTVQ